MLTFLCISKYKNPTGNTNSHSQHSFKSLFLNDYREYKFISQIFISFFSFFLRGLLFTLAISFRHTCEIVNPSWGFTWNISLPLIISYFTDFFFSFLVLREYSLNCIYVFFSSFFIFFLGSRLFARYVWKSTLNNF